MRYLCIIVLLIVVGCSYIEPIGEGMKIAAPVVRDVTPAPYGDALYFILTGVGTLLVTYAGQKGYRKLTSR